MGRSRIRCFVTETLLFLLFSCTISTEAGLSGLPECISGHNYCHRSDVCAYVFTIERNSDDTCPALAQAMGKLEDIHADVDLLNEKHQQTSVQIDGVEGEVDSLLSMIYQLNEGLNRLGAGVDLQPHQLPRHETQITDLQNQIDRLNCLVERKTLELGSTDTNIVPSVSVPPLTALTSCIRAKPVEASRSPSLVSYAVTGDYNEFIMHDTAGLMVFIKSANQATSLNVNDGTWHHLCVTWSSSGGTWKYYHNGVLFDSGTGLKSGQTVTGGGTIVLGQEQDSVGGGFTSDQAFLGSLSEFNMWSRVLSDDEIAEVEHDCSVGGDIFAWGTDQLQVSGDVTEKIGCTCE